MAQTIAMTSKWLQSGCAVLAVMLALVLCSCEGGQAAAKTPPVLLSNYHEGAWSLPLRQPGEQSGKADTRLAPRLITTVNEWHAFVESLPALVPGGSVMGEMVDNQDTITIWEPDFEHAVVLLLFQDASRNGRFRFKSAGLIDQSLQVQCDVLAYGLEARPVDLGYYTAFELYGARPAAKVEVQFSKALDASTRYLELDPATERYGIRDSRTGAWVVSPTWQYAESLDPWDHLVVASPEGRFVMLDTDGKQLYTMVTYDNGPDYWVEGLSRYTNAAGLIGYLDITGREVITAGFEYAEPFYQGVAVVGRGGKMVTQGEHKVYLGGERNTINTSGDILGDWK